MKLLATRSRAVIYLVIASIIGVVQSPGYPRHPSAGAEMSLPDTRLVDVDGHRIAVSCVGRGNPTVVLVSGLGDLSLVWGDVQLGVARFTRVCAYDRNGFGRSEWNAYPHDPLKASAELSALLSASGIHEKIILVGHSYGGDIARVYTSEHPNRVGALVLVEASNEDKWVQRLPPELLGQWRDLLLNCRRDIRRAERGDKISTPSVDMYPRRYGSSAVAGLKSLPALRAMCAEVEGFLTVGPAQVARADIAGVPLTVVSAGRNIFESDTALLDKDTPWQTWKTMQHEELGLSRNSQQVIAASSGHTVAHDQPELLVNVINDVWKACRTGLSSCRH